MLPDLDVMGFRFGLSYGDHFGHRGFTHSLLFALLCAPFAAMPLQWNDSLSHRKRALLFFLATASHPLLDMLTTGGLGCAFAAPISWHRYFAPDFMRVIPVSPIGIKASVVGVIFWEFLIVWPYVAAATLSVRSHKDITKFAVWSLALCVSMSFIYIRLQS